MEKYEGVINSEVQETMILYAEALTVLGQKDKIEDAVHLYEKIIDALEFEEVPVDIHRKLAPLYTSVGQYSNAIG